MSALDRQVGGDHYKGFAIQPAEFNYRNNIGFLPGCVIKRMCRFELSGGKGREDLEKAKHEIEIMLSLSADGPDFVDYVVGENEGMGEK